MWDVNQRQKTSPQTSLSQWLYQAIDNDEVRLRIRLRGNILHILCEGARTPQQNILIPRVLHAFDRQSDQLEGFLKRAKEPVYKIIIYGRASGEQKAAWIEPISLERLNLTPSPEAALESKSVPLASNESLARMGSTEAIARYLSDCFSHLGVSIKTLVQKLPPASRQDEPQANKRLWVVCNCDYSPDAQLLAEPIAQKLRSLELTGFREAAIRAQVSGETSPEWILQVDLTHPEILLRDWARWGEVEAIARLLDRALEPRGLQASAILKETTLHVFCSLRPAQPKEALEASAVKSEVAPLLESIAPQGITAAALYGVEGPKISLDLPETPIWVDWLKLPAASDPALVPSPQTLARENRLDALVFILQRLLNPDLETRLATGGLRVRVCCKDRLLHLLVEGIVCPSRSQILPSMEATLQELELDNLAGARVYGRRAGQSSPSWSAKIEFKTSSPAAASESFFPVGENPLLDDASSAIAPSPETAAPSKPQSWETLRQSLEAGLSASKMWIPLEQTDALSAALQQEETGYGQTTARGFKTIAAWGMAGLLLVAAGDRLLGGMLAGDANRAGLETPLDLAGAPSLPEIPLQRSTSEQARGFNSAQFTRPDRNAAAAAILAAARASNPSFNNTLLDEKLALYQERVRTRGVPDVLIVGSSRAMRGIDPAKLQQAIGKRGDRALEVFNFGINGATARVVDLLLRQVLDPEQLPKLIIWADGARAFNSGRSDRTYEAIATSAGYRQLQARKFPHEAGGSARGEAGLLSGQATRVFKEGYQNFDRTLQETLAAMSATYPQREELSVWLRSQPSFLRRGVEREGAGEESLNLREAIDLDGFLSLSVRFDPATYYARHPKVAGAYDSDYDSFNVEGEQYEALGALTEYLASHQVELVFVNLPLTNIYLDSVRRQHELEFTARMQQAATQYPLIFRDLGQRWPQEYALFSDPSHLNRYGADRVSLHLAKDAEIPWQF